MASDKNVRPFEEGLNYLQDHLEEMVNSTYGDLQSQFMLLPKGPNFVDYADYQEAYEVLKRHTAAFTIFDEAHIWSSIKEDSLSFVVLRNILGMTPPEWADLAQSETEINIDQGAARKLDVDCRVKRSNLSGNSRDFIAKLNSKRSAKTLERIEAMVKVAVHYINNGAGTSINDGFVHRLYKADTIDGLLSLQHVASQHVPYAILLYERYLGRPFASQRDAVSELVGETMEMAIEEILTNAKISCRKIKRAERINGFDQAPDFLIPDEYNPTIAIEAKITNDDGTARDKFTRIIHLVELSEQRVREGRKGFQVIACIDGRGFGIRREDMRRLLQRTQGKVFTTKTLDKLIEYTNLRYYLPTTEI